MEHNEISFLRLPKVLELIPVSKSTWWAGIKTGRFPAGKKLSLRVTAWDRRDIIELAEKLSKDEGGKQ